ncbi:MAG: TetR/AcrR family transcriptional regulator [Pseudomonadota bacterium]
MARTRAADHEEKREAITLHAAKLFARRGFAGASISDLARACGSSKSLIYHYYSAKEDILFDVMHGHVDELVRLAETPRVGDAEARFRDATQDLLKAYAGAEDAQKILLYELDKLPSDQRAKIVGTQRTIVEVFETLLAEARPQISDIGARTMLYFGMVNWVHTWFDPRKGLSRDALAKLIADTALGRV